MIQNQEKTIDEENDPSIGRKEYTENLFAPDKCPQRNYEDRREYAP